MTEKEAIIPKEEIDKAIKRLKRVKKAEDEIVEECLKFWGEIVARKCGNTSKYQIRWKIWE